MWRSSGPTAHSVNGATRDIFLIPQDGWCPFEFSCLRSGIESYGSVASQRATLDHVAIYDIKEKVLIRRITLPGWSVADYICQPDIALDQSGAALISDNAQPRLWQIDADSFQFREHVIRLINKEHWDIGFGGLAVTADETLFAIDASGGSLWVLNINSASAHQVPLDTRALPGLTQHPYCKRATATAQ